MRHTQETQLSLQVQISKLFALCLSKTADALIKRPFFSKAEIHSLPQIPDGIGWSWRMATCRFCCVLGACSVWEGWVEE